MKLEYTLKNLDLDLKPVLVYLLVLLVAIVILFNKQPIDKSLAMYVVLVFVFQLPGTFAISCITGKIGKTEMLLGLGPGIVWAGIVAYLLGLMHISFKTSLIISTCLAYLLWVFYQAYPYIFRASGLQHNPKGAD